MADSGYTSNKRQLILQIRQAELEGLKRTGRRIAQNARRRVRKKSHRLEKSIKLFGQPKRGPDGYDLEIGSDVPYAGIQEFGPRDPDRKYGYTPYLAPAFDEEAPHLAADINEVMNGNA